jgi:hypothetical protein
VLLEDCGHTCEIGGLDNWMGDGSEQAGALVRRCPKCKTIVGNSRRYGRILKECLKDVMIVKKRIFGEEKNIQRKLYKIATKLEEKEFGELNFIKEFIRMKILREAGEYVWDGLKKVHTYCL